MRAQRRVYGLLSWCLTRATVNPCFFSTTQLNRCSVFNNYLLSKTRHASIAKNFSYFL